MRCAAVVLLIAMLAGAAAAEGRPQAAKRIHTVGSCDALIAYAKRHVRTVSRPRIPRLEALRDTAPAVGAPGDTSQTNVQEAGVDEPDIVETGGRGVLGAPRRRRTPTR